MLSTAVLYAGIGIHLPSQAASKIRFEQNVGQFDAAFNAAVRRGDSTVLIGPGRIYVHLNNAEGSRSPPRSSGAGIEALASNLEPTIEPGLELGTFIGGSGFDDVRSVAVAANDDFWVAGTTNSPDFPAPSGTDPFPSQEVPTFSSLSSPTWMEKGRTPTV